MMQAQNGAPPKPEGYSLQSFFRRCVWEALWGGKLPFADTNTVKFSWNGSSYQAEAAPPGRGGGTEAWPPVIYDIGSSYSVGDWVWVQASDTIVTTGEIYPPTGLTALSKSGPWRCVKDAPAGYFPVAPYPTPDDPTAADMYWLYFGNLYC